MIGMIVDPEAAAAAAEAGEGALLGCAIGAKIGYRRRDAGRGGLAGRAGRSGDFVGTGPMFGGAKFHVGPVALVTDEESGVSAVLAASASRRSTRSSSAMSASSRPQVPILALKSTVHFRADFQPIAETVLCVVARRACHRSGRPALSPPARGIRLRPLGPVSG